MGINGLVIAFLPVQETHPSPTALVKVGTGRDSLMTEPKWRDIVADQADNECFFYKQQ